MQYRRLGRSGLHVSAIGLGNWLTTGDDTDPEKTYACMKKAYDLGVNFFDTAESYSDGQSEISLGKALSHFKWKRSDVVISTSMSSHESTATNHCNSNTAF